MRSISMNKIENGVEETDSCSQAVVQTNTPVAHCTNHPEVCSGCKSSLYDPMIKCSECNPTLLLCISCFSCGVEFDDHKNNHSYEVICNSFPVFEYSWSAAEEMRLLEAISDCGVGNWSAIAKQVLTKTALECASHYVKYYVINGRYPLPEFPSRNMAKWCPPVPFKACEDPCRPLPESHRAQNMAGYLAARGDFPDEHLNAAESDIKDVQFCVGEWPILKALKLTMVKIYHSRLVERRRRKEVLSKHGLINNTNHRIHFYSKLDVQLQLLEEQFRPVVKLQHPIAHDKMFAGVIAEYRLLKKVKKLQKYRIAGIKSLRVGKLYNRLSAKHELLQRSSCLDEVLSHKNDPSLLLKWLQTYPCGTSKISLAGPGQSASRRSTAPIDISILPGVERLTSQEKKFCSTARIVPEAYLKYKKILVTECEKVGSMKLVQARTLVKIDVNKTRKLYDFMREQGYFVLDSCIDV